MDGMFTGGVECATDGVSVAVSDDTWAETLLEDDVAIAFERRFPSVPVMKAKHDIIMGGFLSEFNRTFYARCFSKITVITNLIAQNLVKIPSTRANVSIYQQTCQ